MDTIAEVRDFVEKECKNPKNIQGYEPFMYHFAPMVEYALQLAGETGADMEIVAIAGWLHDIGSIIEGRENHHISGAKIAETKLKELKYPQDKIERVKNCILNHRGSIQRSRDSLEEKVIAEADTMSNFDNIAGIFKAAYEYENLDQGQAKVAVREKLQNKYEQLHFEKSKDIIRPKYEAAMLLLS